MRGARVASENDSGGRQGVPHQAMPLVNTELELVPEVEALLEVLDVLEEDHLFEERFAKFCQRNQCESKLLFVQPRHAGLLGRRALVREHAVIAGDGGEASLIWEAVSV